MDWSLSRTTAEIPHSFRYSVSALNKGQTDNPAWKFTSFMIFHQQPPTLLNFTPEKSACEYLATVMLRLPLSHGRSFHEIHNS